MQLQDTSSPLAGQPSVVGRFVLTAILDGDSDGVDQLFRAISAVAPRHGVKLAAFGTQGPLADDDERLKIPTIPPFQKPSGGPSVFLDPDQDQKPLNFEADSVGASDTSALADRSAERTTDDNTQNQAGQVLASAASQREDGEGADSSPRNGADYEPERHPGSDDSLGLGLHVLSVPVQPAVVVADQNSSANGSPEVSESEPFFGVEIEELETARDTISRIMARVPANMRDFVHDLLFNVPNAGDDPADPDAPPPAPEPPPIAAEVVDRPR